MCPSYYRGEHRGSHVGGRGGSHGSRGWSGGLLQCMVSSVRPASREPRLLGELGGLLGFQVRVGKENVQSISEVFSHVR